MKRPPPGAEQLRLAESAIAAGRMAEAMELLRTAIRQDRNSAHPRLLLAYALSRSGNVDEAIVVLRRLIERFPAHGDGWFNLGNLLRTERRFDEAVRAFRRAAALQPHNPAPEINLSYVLAHLGDMKEAEEAVRKALARFPTEPELLVNLGQILRAERRWTEALGTLGACITLAPEQSAYRVTRAIVLAEAGEIARAEAELRAVLEREPENADAHAQLAYIHLSQLHFQAGWQEYRWRESRLLWPGSTPELEDLRGRDVVLCGEQGLGDVLMFLRYVPRLKSVARAAYADIDSRIHPILPPDLLDGLSVPEDALRVVLGDVPGLLRADAMPPIQLVPDSSRVASFQARLAQLGPAPYIGLSWQAGFTWETMSRPGGALFKRIDPAALGGAFASLPGTLLSLQRAPVEADVAALRKAAKRTVHDFSKVNDYLPDALALLAAIDEHVTVSNTNVHLAAGLSKKTRVLVTSPAEWRWTFTEERSPWFPYAVLYREERRGGWEPALARLRQDLQRQ